MLCMTLCVCLLIIVYSVIILCVRFVSMGVLLTCVDTRNSACMFCVCDVFFNNMQCVNIKF